MKYTEDDLIAMSVECSHKDRLRDEWRATFSLPRKAKKNERKRILKNYNNIQQTLSL
jgi:hypothetical protein